MSTIKDKVLAKKYHAKWVALHPARHREIGLAAAKRWRDSHPVERRLAVKKWQRENPEAQAVYNAYRRCTDSKNQAYENYGGRGIECRLTTESLIDAIGRRSSPIHTLDRVDNDGHYERTSVRWATRKEQANNRRKARLGLK